MSVQTSSSTFGFHCRLCYTIHNRPTKIFELKEGYPEILLENLSIQISKVENFPESICMQCKNTIIYIKSFRERILTSHASISFSMDSGKPVLDLCRLCSKPHGKKPRPIFEERLKFKQQKEVSIADRILDLLNITIESDDAWPSKACEKCWTFISDIVKFKHKIIQTHTRLVRQANPHMMSDPNVLITPELPRASLDHEEGEEIPPPSNDNSKSRESQNSLSGYRNENKGTPSKRRKLHEENMDYLGFIVRSEESPFEVEQKEEEGNEIISFEGREDESQSSKDKTEEEDHPEINPLRRRGITITSAQVAELEKMLESLDILTCNSCGEKTADLSALKRHVEENHDISSYNYCCGRKLEKNGRMMDHVQIHMNKSSFKCHKCGKCFCNRDILSKHFRLGHRTAPTPPINPYCKECQMMFRTPIHLNEHIERVHEGRVFFCKYCKKVFRWKDSLTEHVLELHGGS